MIGLGCRGNWKFGVRVGRGVRIISLIGGRLMMFGRCGENVVRGCGVFFKFVIVEINEVYKLVRGEYRLRMLLEFDIY